MKKWVFWLLLVIFLLMAFPNFVNAHPGNTASDGCHYCRTNCDSWGVPWNARHCHGGYTAPVQSLPSNTPTPKPTNIPTPKPTNTPNPTSTNTPTPEPTNTPTSTPTPIETVTPEVKGETTEPTITSQVSSSTTNQEGNLAELGI